jgi:hypothetical protein
MFPIAGSSKPFEDPTHFRIDPRDRHVQGSTETEASIDRSPSAIASGRKRSEDLRTLVQDLDFASPSS